MHVCMQGAPDVVGWIYFSPFDKGGNADGFFSHLDSQEEMFCWPQTEQPNEPWQEEINLAGASREIS